MSGYGNGVENFNVGFGKAALAFLGGARPEIVTNAGAYSKVNIDTRVYDIKAPLGKVAFWFDYAVAKGGTTQKGVTFPTATGYAFGFTHQRLKWEGGYTQFGVQYGKGAASYFSSSLDNPTIYLKNSDRLLITEQVVVQPNNKFAIMPIAVYQRVKDGLSTLMQMLESRHFLAQKHSGIAAPTCGRDINGQSDGFVVW